MMSTTWVTCDVDLLQDDQVQQTLSDNGSMDTQLIQNWIVETDGTSRSSPVEALSAAVAGGKSLPSVTSFLASPLNLFQVTRVLPKRKGPYSFNVQLEAHWKYTPPLPSAKSSVTIDFDGQEFTQDAYNDSTGTAIINSAYQSFDPSLPKTYYDESIDISYVTTSDQSAAFASVRGKVNNAALSFNIQGVARSFPHRGLLCKRAKQTATLPLGDGTPAFKVDATFISRADTYITSVLDQGFYSLDSGDLAPIPDANGDPIVTPARLDGSGNVLESGAAPVYITFKMEAEADFTSIFTGLA